MSIRRFWHHLALAGIVFTSQASFAITCTATPTIMAGSNCTNVRFANAANTLYATCPGNNGTISSSLKMDACTRCAAKNVYGYLKCAS